MNGCATSHYHKIGTDSTTTTYAYDSMEHQWETNCPLAATGLRRIYYSRGVENLSQEAILISLIFLTNYILWWKKQKNYHANENEGKYN